MHTNNRRLYLELLENKNNKHNPACAFPYVYPGDTLV